MHLVEPSIFLGSISGRFVTSTPISQNGWKSSLRSLTRYASVQSLRSKRSDSKSKKLTKQGVVGRERGKNIVHTLQSHLKVLKI